MQESLWWWQYSGRYIISLFPHLHTPFPPFSPSLISLMVSVEIKHHVYFTLHGGVCGGGGGGNGEGGGGLAAGCENCRPVDSGRTQAKKLKNFVSSSSTWKEFSSKYTVLKNMLPLLKRCITSTESTGLLRTGRPGHPPRLSHSSWGLLRPQKP